MTNLQAGRLGDRLQSWFPEREFFMRSHGQVRFIKISTRVQIVAAGLTLSLVLGWGVSMAAMAVGQISARTEMAALLDREAKVASAESRVSAYRDDLESVGDDLQQRMEFIEKVMPMLPDDVKAEETVSDSSEEAGRTVEQVSAVLPEAATLAQIEARQLALVEKLTRFADRRSAQASDAIRRLGLNPDRMIAGTRTAQGGPLEKLFTGKRGAIDPRFERMGSAWRAWMRWNRCSTAFRRSCRRTST